MKYIKSYKIFESNLDMTEDYIDYIKKFFNMYSIDGYISLFDTLIEVESEKRHNLGPSCKYIINGLQKIKDSEITLLYTSLPNNIEQNIPICWLGYNERKKIIDIINEKYPEYKEGGGMGFFDLKTKE